MSLLMLLLLLLLADPGSRVASKCWTLGYWAVVLSTRSCWENNFNFGICWWIMRSRIFNRKFFISSSICRRSVSNCWTLGCRAVVLSTRPRSSCWESNSELPDDLRGRRILTENILSLKSLPDVERELPFKNYTKFFGGNLGLEHLHPLPPHTQYLVAIIVNWRLENLLA